MHIHIKRVYDTPASTDGLRVLVDRLWPRGLKKEDAAMDVWAKDLAPSNELRRWFGDEVEKFQEFTRRYRLELDSTTAEIHKLMASAGGSTVTFLYGARNTKCNNAIVLQAWLQRRLKTIGETQEREYVRSGEALAQKERQHDDDDRPSQHENAFVNNMHMKALTRWRTHSDLGNFPVNSIPLRKDQSHVN